MQHKRSKQLVDRSVQGQLVLRVLAHWVVFLVGSFSVLTVWQLLLSGDPLNPFSAQMQDIWTHSAPVFVVLAVLIPVFVWDTVKFSNRFTGPMYRLRSSIRDLAQGGEPRPIPPSRRRPLRLRPRRRLRRAGRRAR